MTIQIDGANTTNKGAELMLYAVLEEIERKYPEAGVVYNGFGVGYKRVESPIRMRGYSRLSLGTYPWDVQKKLRLPYGYFTWYHPVKGIDIILDVSGFKLGDQWNRNEEYIKTLDRYYKNLKSYGTKVILLPQALGPFKTPMGKRTSDILNSYIDLIMPRESVSYNYLLEAGVDISKVQTFPDFTNLVKGVLPEELEYLKRKVCIIPNKKMITHTAIGANKYIATLKAVVNAVRNKGLDVFLLNHEGNGDLRICKQISAMFGNSLDIVSGLNAKEVKAVIGVSYFTFSSRYHGVANALGQGVPCLATSWSHKYKLLFDDYNMVDQIIDINASPMETEKFISSYLDPATNENLRLQLANRKPELENTTKKMWEVVWNKVKK